MKKIVIFFIYLSFSLNYSQSINDKSITKVIYKSSIYKNGGSVNPNISNIQSKLTQYYESFEYELYFSNQRSYYKLSDKINFDDNTLEYQITRGLVNELYFKDIVEKQKIKQTTSFDELFNVLNPFDEYKWEITTETKLIDGYTCYKATCKYEEYDLNRKINLKFEPTVWFAPSLPYPYGPCGLDGLPGLVLEATYNGRVYFYATNITFNDKSILSIDKPKKGKYISATDYKLISNENFQKTMEQN